jgi:hypothetical protein
MAKLGDFDVWYKVCGHCGYDTARSTIASVKHCWKCGRRVSRDYSDRALKSNAKVWG